MNFQKGKKNDFMWSLTASLYDIDTYIIGPYFPLLEKEGTYCR